MYFDVGNITPDKTWQRINEILYLPKEIQLVYNTDWNAWNNDTSLRSYGGLRFYSSDLEGVINYFRINPTQLNQIILVPDKIQLLDVFVEVRHYSFFKRSYWKPSEELIWSVDINYRF